MPLIPMSKFNDAFGSAAKTLMSVFGETTTATYMPATGSAQSLNVVVEHDVVGSDQLIMALNSVVIVSWFKADRDLHRRGDKIALSNGKEYRLDKFEHDDGLVISYQVIDV